jgi:hypothetical protein
MNLPKVLKMPELSDSKKEQNILKIKIIRGFFSNNEAFYSETEQPYF